MSDPKLHEAYALVEQAKSYRSAWLSGLQGIGEPEDVARAVEGSYDHCFWNPEDRNPQVKINGKAKRLRDVLMGYRLGREIVPAGTSGSSARRIGMELERVIPADMARCVPGCLNPMHMTVISGPSAHGVHIAALRETGTWDQMYYATSPEGLSPAQYREHWAREGMAILDQIKGLLARLENVHVILLDAADAQGQGGSGYTQAQSDRPEREAQHE